ncbi:type I-E CRISPR-associated protein Cas6/Cse3/CasE [Actinomadura madurae]|uniref:type I-E CRISPR-associated protein Cas6/Cse3/CasE n=1 Tax=Actinomadura madurae TaxID=1993 RepID=UPI0020271554|nr:type I-E CRISPR-associated protein Cas6/Cse3/CasE [Actinomadura madurae]URN07661.1 type I-E CRISPR-associated protein Cas6/Cse3/CasE [Actinomadura madurae]
MYLTRFRINPERIGARKLLSSPQVLHAAVMSSFAELPDQRPDAPRVLWRIDRDTRHRTHLCIVSPYKPDLTHLVEQAGWPTTARWETYDYGPFLDRLNNGDRWAFRLTANPVHSVRNKDGAPTKATAHISPRHQMSWLLQRQESGGFAIVRKPSARDHHDEMDQHELIVHNRRQLAFKKKGGSKPVTLVTVTFDGRLDVTDAEAFRRTLTHGVGKAKAYGCGLMTLATA